MAANFLHPAMGRLTVQEAPVVWKESALGTPAARSYLGLNFAGAPTTVQVKIQWKHILVDTVQKLGGSEPLYYREDSTDDMFQIRVSFSLPLNSTGTMRKDIAVIGMKCSTFAKAESEASAAALQELQHGLLKICIVDVSRTRCKELERRCHEILANGHEMYKLVKSLLADWEEDMNKAEGCYSPARHIALQSSCQREGSTNGDIMPDVADKLADLTSAHYLKLKDLTIQTEKAKIYIETVHERVAYFFQEAYLHQANEHRGILPQEIELSMKLVLQELTMSIGWPWPSYNVTSSGMNLYVCRTTLFPSHTPTGAEPKALIIDGPEGLSEEEAVESSCRTVYRCWR